MSGVLDIANGVANIGYNPSESKVRQRYTLAHELGHFVLHYNDNKTFVDNEKFYQFKMFRSGKLNLSNSELECEREANAFAAALLMPQTLLNKELEAYEGFDLSDSTMITELAKKFEVSTQAMSFRIFNLVESELL